MTNYHLKRLHRSSNLLHPDTTDISDMPEIIYTHIHSDSYPIISMKKKVDNQSRPGAVQDFGRQPHSPICRQVGAWNPGAV